MDSAREFIHWLTDENYIFIGAVRYEPGPDGNPVQIEDSVNGAFKDPALVPVVFLCLLEEVEPRVLPAPGDDTIVGLDYGRNASALYHLDPIDYVVLREFDTDGSVKGAMLLLGRFARGPSSSAPTRSRLERESRVDTESAAPPNSHIYREIRATFNRFLAPRTLYSTPESSSPSSIRSCS